MEGGVKVTAELAAELVRVTFFSHNLPCCGAVVASQAAAQRLQQKSAETSAEEWTS